MTKATKFEKSLMRAVQVDSQLRGEDQPLVTDWCIKQGWLARDLHGCLFLTDTGREVLKHNSEAQP